MTAVTLSEEDIPFEEQLQRTPYDFKLWWKYIQIKIRMYNFLGVGLWGPPTPLRGG